MKIIAKNIAIAITSLTMLFAGCSNSVDGSVGNYALLSNISSAEKVTKEAVSSSGVSRTLNLTATSKNDLVSFTSGESRTITPGAYKASDLDFYLFGSNFLTNAALFDGNAVKVDFKASNTLETEGTVPVELSVSNYKLYLVAVPTGTTLTAGTAVEGYATSVTKDSALAKAVLYANANVDLRYNQDVKFYLSPDNLSGTGGAITLNVRAWDWDGSDYGPWHNYDYYALISINKINDGSVIVNGSTVTQAVSDASAANIAATAPESYRYKIFVGSNSPTFTNSTFTKSTITSWGKFETSDGLECKFTGVPTGTYNVVIEFSNAKNESDKDAKHYYYSDNIMVLTNQAITATVDVPNIIAKPPVAISDLHVGYNDASTDSGSITYDSDYYLATFQWADNSTNEEYFVLQLLDITDMVASYSELGLESYLSTEAKTLVEKVAAAPDGYVAGAAYTDAENAWNAALAASPAAQLITYDKYVYQKTDSLYAAGSLDKNSTSLSLWLPLGRVYAARMCAYNDSCPAIASDSKNEWVYANTNALTNTAAGDTAGDRASLVNVFTSTSVSGTLSGTFTPKTWPKIDAAGTTETTVAPLAINRYRVAYHLNKGEYWTVNANGQLTNQAVNETKATAGTKQVFNTAQGDSKVTNLVKDVDSLLDTIYEYHTMTAKGAALMNPVIYTFTGSDSASHTATLYNGKKVWTCWKKNNVSGIVVDGGIETVFRQNTWVEAVTTGATLKTEADLLGAAPNCLNETYYDINTTTYAAANLATDPCYYVKRDYGYVRTAAYTSDIADTYDPQIATTAALADVQGISKEGTVVVRGNFANYFTFANLELYANYNATSGEVGIYSPDNYDLGTANIRITKATAAAPTTYVSANAYMSADKGTLYYAGATPDATATPKIAAATYTDNELDKTEFLVSQYFATLNFMLVENGVVAYRSAYLDISTTGGTSVFSEKLTSYSGTYTPSDTTVGSKTGAAGGDPFYNDGKTHNKYQWDVNLISFTPGKYNATFMAYTDVNEKNPFTYVVTFTVEDKTDGNTAY